MRRGNLSAGFTVIEITLFLAVTGLILLFAFSGVSTRTRFVQFTDSMRSLQSFLQEQMNQVQTGVNTAATGNRNCSVTDVPNFENTYSFSIGPPGTATGECILFGKIFDFGAAGSNTITVRTMLGRRLGNEKGTFGCTDNNFSGVPPAEICVEPWEDPSQRITYSLRWGVTFKNGWQENITGNDSNAFGFVRSPFTPGLNPIAFQAGVDVNDDLLYRGALENRSAFRDEVDGYYCFQDEEGRLGRIDVQLNNESALELNMSPDTCGPTTK